MSDFQSHPNFFLLDTSYQQHQRKRLSEKVAKKKFNHDETQPSIPSHYWVS